MLVHKLLEAGYNVTVLTRSRSALKDCPANAKVAEVDYKSIESLTEALTGQDAVVGTLASAAVPLQTNLIDAATRAGVKHFIPSDYGVITVEPEASKLPVAAQAVEIQNYLKKKAAKGEISYSILACGAMMEYILPTPMLLDFANHKAFIYDGGNATLSMTSYATCADAIAAILGDIEAWKNKIVYVHDVVISQNKVLEMAKKAAPSTTWTEVPVDTAPMMKDGMEALKKGEFNMSNFVKILTAAAFNGQYQMAFKNTDNEALGLGFMSDDHLFKVITERVQMGS